MSELDVSVLGDSVQMSDARAKQVAFFEALCDYAGLPRDNTDPEVVINGSIAAVEYGATISIIAGANKEMFLEFVSDLWDKVNEGVLINRAVKEAASHKD